MLQPKMENDPVAPTTESPKLFNPKLEKGINVMNNSTMLQNCNSLVSIVDGLAVTTSEIVAEKSENQHKNVIELIRKNIDDLQEFGEVAFETRLNSQGSSTQIALLNEQQVTLLFTYMRNTDVVRKFKKDLVKAFFYLAQKARDPMEFLNDPASMRGLLLNYSEKVIALEEKIQQDAPKITAFDTIATKSEGSMCVTDAAKILQIKPKTLFKWLHANLWIYKRAGGKSWIAYQIKQQQGLLEHKVTNIPLDDGSEKISIQVLVTPKGLTKLAELVVCEVA